MPSQHSVLDEVREEMDALALMSYHGGIDGGPWYADLCPDDVDKIRALFGCLLGQLEAAHAQAGSLDGLYEQAKLWAQCLEEELRAAQETADAFAFERDDLKEQLEAAQALVEMARDPQRWDEFLAASADHAGEVPSLPYGGSNPASEPKP